MEPDALSPTPASTAAAGETVADLSVLHPVKVPSIRGFLRTPAGAGLAHYFVNAVPLGEVAPGQEWRNNKSAKSEADGGFSFFDLEPGRYYLFASGMELPFAREALQSKGKGELPTMHEERSLFFTHDQGTVVTLVEGAQEEVILIFKEGMHITGRAVDPAGKPVPFARISARLLPEDLIAYTHPMLAELPAVRQRPGVFGSIDEVETSADAQGKFRLATLFDTDFDVVANAKGYRWAKERVAAGTENATLVLTPLGKSNLNGRVIDMDTGRPISDFEIGYLPYANGQWGTAEKTTIRQAVHHTEGRFSLELEEEARGFIWAESAGYFRNLFQLSGDAGNADEMRPEIELALPRGRMVRGQVLDPEGNSVPKALLFLGAPMNPSTAMMDDETLGVAGDDGRFALNFPNRRAILSAGMNHETWKGRGAVVGDSVFVAAGSGDVDDVTLRLSSSGSTLVGMVRFRGAPLATRIDIGSQIQMGRFWGADSDEKGRFSVSELPPLADFELSMGSVISPGLVLPQVPGASPVKHIRASRTFSVARESETTADLSFDEGSATLQGAVWVDGAREASVYSSLTITRADGTHQTYSFGVDDDANFRLVNLPAGKGRLNFFLDDGVGQYRWERVVMLVEGKEETVNCSFVRSDSVSNPPWPHPYLEEKEEAF